MIITLVLLDKKRLIAIDFSKVVAVYMPSKHDAPQKGTVICIDDQEEFRVSDDFETVLMKWHAASTPTKDPNAP